MVCLKSWLRNKQWALNKILQECYSHEGTKMMLPFASISVKIINVFATVGFKKVDESKINA